MCLQNQTDGTPIGKSILGHLADIYIERFENEDTHSERNELRDHKSLEKKIDEVIQKQIQLQKLVTEIIGQHESNAGIYSQNLQDRKVV